MAVTIKELDGRKWSDGTGRASVTRHFEIYGLSVGFDPSWSYTGLPAVGDSHPTFTGYVVTRRDFEEGKGKDKCRVEVAVTYEPQSIEGGGETEIPESAVEEIGWDDATEDRELINGVDGTPVKNSAGDPFESVPTVPTPAQVFTKVIKTKSLVSGALDYMCKVNKSSVTIMGKSCPVGTLLCTISPKRIFNDPSGWKYRYTIKLKFKSNMVAVEGSDTMTECGWDACITDAGMRAKQTVGGVEKVALIKQTDPETGKPCTVTSPALLNGRGYTAASDTSGVSIYNFRFQAHERTSFPSWFYSEPT